VRCGKDDLLDDVFVAARANARQAIVAATAGYLGEREFHDLQSEARVGGRFLLGEKVEKDGIRNFVGVVHAMTTPGAPRI